MPSETVEVTIRGTKEQVELAKGEMGKSGLLGEKDVLRVCTEHSAQRRNHLPSALLVALVVNQTFDPQQPVAKADFDCTARALLARSA